MFKENGRTEPAPNEETASILAKTFICNTCGTSSQLTNVQFGALVMCGQCGGTMNEKLLN